MKIALDNPAGANLVKAYEPGRVQIRNDYYATSLIVSRDRLLSDWQQRHADELQAHHLQAVLAEERPVALALILDGGSD